MRKILFILQIFVCILFCFSASAQLTKKETKEWKKRIKSLKPEQLKEIIDENESLKSRVNSLQSELSSIDNTIADKDGQIMAFQKQIKSLRVDLSKAKAKPAVENNAPTSGGFDMSKGIIFKVQLGAFAFKDMRKLANMPVFGAESENGLIKYTLGVFQNYQMADDFKKHLRSMGVTDAWIVSYKDGKRVPFKEVVASIEQT